MTCLRCHRPLKNPESIALGYGPICYSKHLFDMERDPNNKNACHVIEGEFNGDVIVYRREDGTLVTNITQEIVRHSPTGFEIGYMGSGPAEFALNILNKFCQENTRDKLYQSFKDFWLTTRVNAGSRPLEITKFQIDSWLEFKGCVMTEGGKWRLDGV